MYKPQNYIEKPINVLSFDSFGHAILNYEAIQIIQSIQKPISILSIAGPYRTGKSFLLNSLIGGQEKFTVSSTTRSCTKGLWIWGKPITSVDQEGKLTNILIMDTEGFGSCEETYDKRIIILALLLSTCFIFNSKGVIDSDALKDLQYVIQQTKKVKKQLCFDSATDFHWVLRDFHYLLVNQLNVKIEPDQYMEQCLKEYSANSPLHKQVYKMLCQFFRSRKCHTIVTPETDPSIEQNPQFVQQLIRLKKILNRVPSLNLDGLTLAEIIEAYVSAMNQNYTQSGVERQGAECCLRINCLSKLCRELDAIKEEQPEKRAKLTRLALHEVEDNIISKMTSEKQIRILKEELNVIISQFQEQGAASSAKKLKNREPRNSLSLAKIKQHRVCSQLQQFSSEKQVRINNKSQLVALQKLREDLQSKIHRYQLEIGQISADNQSLKLAASQLEKDNLNFQQRANKLEEQLRKKQKEHAFLQLEWEDQLEQSKNHHIEICSQLEKKNKLLEEKIAYLDQKIANMEIQQLESQSGQSSRYKESIRYLESENKQLMRKHEEEIRELREIYQRKQQQSEPLGSESTLKKQSIQLSYEMRAYNDQIFKLQQENSELMMWKHQAEEQMCELQNKLQQIRKVTQIQLESAQKRQKQKQSQINELYLGQISAKEKIIRELQARADQERKFKDEQLMAVNAKYAHLHSQMAELQINFEACLKELKEQCVEACEKYHLEQHVRMEKQKQIERIAAELQIQRQSVSKSYNQHYEVVRKLREEVLASNLSQQQAIAEKQQERQLREQLQKELAREKDQYESYKKQLKNIHQIDVMRLGSKINSLTNANSLLSQVKQKYGELQNSLAQQQTEKCGLLAEFKLKQENLKSLDARNCVLKQENEKLERIIVELTKSININREELGRYSEKNALKLQEREQKLLEILGKLHDKQKQYYLLSERNESTRKQYQNKEKLLQKLFQQKLQQKNKQISVVNNNLSLISLKLQQSESQILRLKNNLSLLQQRYEHLSQNYQLHIKDSKERSSREWQKATTEIGRLQILITKLRQQKDQLLKKISMFENDSRETSFVLIEMRKKYDRHMDQYESNIKAMRRRLTQLQNQNMMLNEKCEKTGRQLSCLQKTKTILEQNYNEDFKLWSTKIKVYEQNQSQRRLSA